MYIYYQGSLGSYSHQVASIIKEKYKLNYDLQGVFSFKDVFDNIYNNGGLGVIPIENSYVGSVHQNLYLMRDYNVEIIGEYFLEVNHCLVSKESDINNIKEVYSHPQALMQCEKFLNKYNFKPIEFSDTAGAAEYISNQQDFSKGAISSRYAAEIYGLNILAEGINDQEGNTTRFLIIKSKSFELDKKFYINPKKGTLLFRVKDKPAILFKCLGAFATRFINLTKIESIPTKLKKFEYMFWVDYIVPDDYNILDDAFDELSFFTLDIKDLGRYAEI